MNTEWKYWKGIVLASTVALLYSEGAGGALRLEDLERMALDNNPTIAQAAAGIRAAEGRTLQAGLYPNPIMGYIGEEISGRAPSRTSEHLFFMEQAIVTAGKLKHNRSIFCASTERGRGRSRSAETARAERGPPFLL